MCSYNLQFINLANAVGVGKSKSLTLVIKSLSPLSCSWPIAVTIGTFESLIDLNSSSVSKELDISAVSPPPRMIKIRSEFCAFSIAIIHS